jgi:hypothetical protein
LSIPPVFSATFYQLIVKGAKQLGVSRAQFTLDAVRYYLRNLNQKKSSAAKALGSEELAKQFSEAHSKIAKKWWSTISDEERSARAKKAVQARWAKAKKKK